MNEIQVGRFNRFFQKHLGIKGGPPVPSLAPEISPNFTLPFFNDILFPLSWNMYGAQSSVVATAANNGDLRLRNPATSNVIAVVLRACVMSTAAVTTFYTLQYGQPTTDAQSVMLRRALDGRLGGSVTGSAVIPSIGFNNADQIGTSIYRRQAPSGGDVEFILDRDWNIILTPGDGIQIQCGTQNQAMDGSLIWLERFLEEGERT